MARSSSVDLGRVHPAIRERAHLLVTYFNQRGWPIVVTSGFRTQDHQLDLIKQGLTTARQSRHTQGLAFDLSFHGLTREQALKLPQWVWQTLGEAGEALGLRWGGRFNDYDPFHFDAG